ncbi:uncharacterized protein EHS24_001439 [Apiotrichum porosum]|uniref:Uncharacterized protein n=1 Tax=Apiotrichum porosum TaxID=105984 RepID=A0A427XKR5_9TREE|nr:uncharacterized protein EHS24_001439 [Apiotrichum porosum]RSH79393.1 hypothetical protein EHS24_001439 [Apiotrichum porosum]
MPPKRPPPLPRSLFVDNGPLSPGFAPAPSPSTIHPDFITDAHTRGAVLAVPPTGPQLTGSVTVTTDGEAAAEPDTTPVQGKHKASLATVIAQDQAAPLNLAPADAAAALDLVVPATTPLTGEQWDRLDEAVDEIDGGREKVESEVAALGDAPRKIMVAGILPPPLSKPSSALLNADEYVLFQARSSQLSLHADVVLKALPPVVDTRSAGDNRWWEDAKSVERAVKLYIAPAIESFGTSRIVFGSTPAVTVTKDTESHLVVPVQGAEWYALLRKCIAEMGQDAAAMTDIMGRNATEYYKLE